MKRKFGMQHRRGRPRASPMPRQGHYTRMKRRWMLNGRHVADVALRAIGLARGLPLHWVAPHSPKPKVAKDNSPKGATDHRRGQPPTSFTTSPTPPKTAPESPKSSPGANSEFARRGLTVRPARTLSNLRDPKKPHPRPRRDSPPHPLTPLRPHPHSRPLTPSDRPPTHRHHPTSLSQRRAKE